MDHVHKDLEPRRSGSFSRISSTNSSFRRNSLILLGAGHNEIDDDNDSRSVSEAGDIGPREIHSRRYSGSASGRSRFSFEILSENVIVPIDQHSLHASPASPHVILHGKDQNEVGSFLMGWFGPVYKGDISKFSPELAVGLTTGYLGSLTTFSGWNQNMLELSVDGHWVYSAFGFLLGLFLVAYSFVAGVTTAVSFKQAINKTNFCSKSCFSQENNIRYQSILIVVMITLLGSLWGVSAALLKKDFNSDNSTSHLWFGCIVGPIGVWIRFYLAQLNGKGIGRRELMKWLPFGTLIANVAACCIMAAFATIKKSVNGKHFDVVASGIQFGFCGCLSTVSTFIAEYRAMEESEHPWRAYVYALTTIIMSFTLGTLIYSVPVWTKGWS
ncbi:hypothetical protein CTI12_AA049250 [Artemisia annua]|uniref:Camphor resistance CrcB family protein n=1 Tax=Artemisia annua TaxID=35608 RepID=A0A2U1QC90_ARTAN|nr:hypothetical protein CTI12_AA049250 [Artemisia annua]